MNKNLFALLLAASCCAWTAQAADQPAHTGHDAAAAPMQEMDKKWKDSLAKPSYAVTATFDEHGRLWCASVQAGHVLVNHSDDGGKSYSQQVRVNAEAENILGDGENRPKIIARKGVIYISYTQGLEKPMTGHIRFSRSLDGGKTFSRPVTVNDNLEIISHRFDSMAVNDRGQVFIAWLDKRDLSVAARKGEKYAGLGLYYAVSNDNGASFQPNIKAADHACECCRTAMAMDADGYPVVVWRHVYDTNIRDHALVKLDGKSVPVRLSHENWNIAACPHHGPAISIASDGVYHAVWFSNAPGRRGVFYAHSADQGKTFSAPMNFGNPDAQSGHPHVISLGSRVYLAWKEFDGTSTGIFGMRSGDSGKSWSAPEKWAATSDVSDRPLLIGDGSRAYLSWNTKNEGYRLIEVSGADK